MSGPMIAKGSGATQPGQSLRNILRGLHHHRVHPNNILLVKREPHAKGGKSEVYKATLVREPDKYNNWKQSKIQVAVKKLRFDDETDQDRTSKAFVRELGVLDGLNHPNIAKLVGFVEDLERGIAWSVSNWETKGNVREYLMSAKCAIPERISLIQDTLEGLLYLHTREPPVCHGNLKSFNILVNLSYHAVITGFGSARFVKRHSPNAGVRPEPVPDIFEDDMDVNFSFRWAAPEVLMGDRSNLPSDIWAAAWTFWEILTDQLPFSNTNSEGAITLGILEGKVPISIQGEHVSQIRDLFRLMTACWALEPKDRPSAEECLEEVRRVPSNISLSAARLSYNIRSTLLSRHPAQTRYLTSDLETVKSIHRSVLEFARPTEDQLAAANALFGLGGAYYVRRDYQLAEEAYIHAQVYYAGAGDLKGRAQAFEELGRVYGTQCLYGNAEISYLRAKTMYMCLKDALGHASALCGLGDVYRARCKYEEAEACYQEARGIHARSGEDRGRANALLGLGQVYSAQSRYREAEETFFQARDIGGDDLARANAWGGLGDVYRAQNKYDEADEAYRSAYTLHTKASDQPGIANALLGLGEVDHARGRYHEAEVMFTQAQTIHEQAGNDVDRATALLGLGDVHRAQRKYDEAEKLFNQALNLSARTDNDLGRANALRGLGDIHLARLDYDQAEDSFVLALNLYGRMGSDGGSADALLGLGHAYRAQTEWDNAEESFKHAQYIYAHIRNNVGRASALSGMGDVYHTLCLYGDAERSYRQAYNLYAGLADDPGKANALVGLGEAYVAQVKYNDAEMAFTRAQKIYTRIGNSPGQANVVRALEFLRRDRAKGERRETYTAEFKRPRPSVRKKQRCGPFRRDRQVTRLSLSATADGAALVHDIGLAISSISPIPSRINGRFCDLFEGIHTKTGKVALKRPRIDPTDDIDVVSRRFEREAALWNRLRHPHILEFLGAFKRDGHMYFVSPFMNNGTLAEYIAARPDVNRIRLLAETADAVQYLHMEQVVHGDLKATNILIHDDGYALLCDFGLTKYIESRTSSAMHGAGTVRWQSPELWQESPKTFASDVYAFGMTIAEVLKGEVPFSDLTGIGTIVLAVMTMERRPSLTPSKSPSGMSYDNIWRVATACWPTAPADRISMIEVLRRIRADPSLT